MLIFIQRGTSVPFFLRFFRGFAPFRRFGTAKDSRFGCGRVTADSSGLPPWCGERLLRQGILTVLSLYSSVECAGVKRIFLLQPKRKKRNQNEIGRAILPPWCGERLLRQEAFGFAPTTTVAGEILASDAGVSRTYEDTLRVRPTGFLFEDPVCSISVLPQRQTVCRMTIFESVILSVSEILCKKLFLCFCCSQKERKTLPFSS